MFFTRAELHLILLSNGRTRWGRIPSIHPVEQSVLGWRRVGALLVVCGECRCVIMIRYGQWSKVDVPICAGGPVNDERGNQTVGVL